jgi:hypothetical protein
MGIIAFERPATSETKTERCNLGYRYLAEGLISSAAALEISSAIGVN